MLKQTFILAILTLLSLPIMAHNGTTGYAYPLGKITIDGDFSDWPRNSVKYPLGVFASDTKPHNESDFSGYFQLGYRSDNHSLYIALTVTDDDFIEDTSSNVRWNTQDALELYLDARHLPFGSGVASFMYSKKLHNTNNSYYDPFAKTATWDIMEVSLRRAGNTRYYEWRIMLGDQLTEGKSIGLDFYAFDMDSDKSFSFASWGPGGSKYVNPRSLSDVIIMPGGERTGTLAGSIEWNKAYIAKLPGHVRLTATHNPKTWVETDLDSLGNYYLEIPAGQYGIVFSDEYFSNNTQLYGASQKEPVQVLVRAGKKTTAPKLMLAVAPAPDLLPEKGVLHDFKPTTANQIDQFIETYQRYYKIPGVSLSIIKDGKLVYAKTYGVRNTFTKQPVDSNTLFEAASVTKPVFAFAIQRLAERGVIDLDKPLYLYLPYDDIAYDERYKLMTARHVLTHRTGFPNWRFMNPDGKLDLKFPPGTAYNYSGEGFEYLKLVIQKITGKKVEQILKEEVIDPVGLYHTFFSRNDSLRQMVANGHFDRLPNYDELPESPGMAYSMHTEARIFTRFMLYLLEQKGLNAQSYETMFRKHSDFNYGPDDKKPRYPSYMGISLEIRETPFGKSFGHGGNNGDFKCRFEVYKDLKMGYAIFTNSNTSDALLEHIREFLVEGKEK